MTSRPIWWCPDRASLTSCNTPGVRSCSSSLASTVPVEKKKTSNSYTIHLFYRNSPAEWATICHGHYQQPGLPWAKFDGLSSEGKRMSNGKNVFTLEWEYYGLLQKRSPLFTIWLRNSSLSLLLRSSRFPINNNNSHTTVVTLHSSVCVRISCLHSFLDFSLFLLIKTSLYIPKCCSGAVLRLTNRNLSRTIFTWNMTETC